MIIDELEVEKEYCQGRPCYRIEMRFIHSITVNSPSFKEIIFNDEVVVKEMLRQSLKDSLTKVFLENIQHEIEKEAIHAYLNMFDAVIKEEPLVERGKALLLIHPADYAELIGKCNMSYLIRRRGVAP